MLNIYMLNIYAQHIYAQHIYAQQKFPLPNGHGSDFCAIDTSCLFERHDAGPRSSNQANVIRFLVQINQQKSRWSCRLEIDF